jgi:hypothetical protein
MSIVFQKTQAPSILKCVVIASEGSSKLTTLLRFLSLSFSDMFFVIGGVLEHNLFVCPLVTSFGFVCFCLGVGSSFFVLSFPLY